jgi:hypothetical protein
MDVVDLTGDCTAATLWQRFAVTEIKECVHCIITVITTGIGTDTVRLLYKVSRIYYCSQKPTIGMLTLSQLNASSL